MNHGARKGWVFPFLVVYFPQGCLPRGTSVFFAVLAVDFHPQSPAERVPFTEQEWLAPFWLDSLKGLLDLQGKGVQNKLSAWAWMPGALLPHRPLMAVGGEGIWHLSALASGRDWGCLTPPSSRGTLISWAQRKECCPPLFLAGFGRWIPLFWKQVWSENILFHNKNSLCGTACRPDVRAGCFCCEEASAVPGSRRLHAWTPRCLLYVAAAVSVGCWGHTESQNSRGWKGPLWVI